MGDAFYLRAQGKVTCDGDVTGSVSIWVSGRLRRLADAAIGGRRDLGMALATVSALRRVSTKADQAEFGRSRVRGQAPAFVQQANQTLLSRKRASSPHGRRA